MAAKISFTVLWLLTICISSSLNCLHMSFDHFSIGGFVFSILICKSFLVCTRNINPLSITYVANIFSRRLLYFMVWEIFVYVCLCVPMHAWNAHCLEVFSFYAVKFIQLIFIEYYTLPVLCSVKKWENLPTFTLRVSGSDVMISKGVPSPTIIKILTFSSWPKEWVRSLI